jgi:hypothetical protein
LGRSADKLVVELANGGAGGFVDYFKHG